jgi:hypothetical protein
VGKDEGHAEGSGGSRPQPAREEGGVHVHHVRRDGPDVPHQPRLDGHEEREVGILGKVEGPEAVHVRL